MKLPLLSAAIVVALAGCSPPGFARIDPFTLGVFENTSTQATVVFDYDSQQLGCQILDGDFSVEMNGEAAVSTSPGKSMPALLVGTECSPPIATVPRPAAFGRTATITATSGGDTVLVEIADLGGKLDAQPILAPGEVVHVGQLVR